MSVLCGTYTGKVYLYSLQKKRLAAIRGEAKPANRVVGLDWIDSSAFGNKTDIGQEVIYANQKGELVFTRMDDALKTTGDQIEESACIGFQYHGKSVVLASATGELTLVTLNFDKTDGIYEVANNHRIFADKALPNLTTIEKSDQGLSRLACLCQDKPPVVFWEGKNVPADELQLKVPMFDTSCTFAENSNLLYTCTAFGKVRKYDFRVAKRRPLQDNMIDKYGMVKVVCNQSTGNLLAASNTGQIYHLDTAANLQTLRKYNEAQGSVTDISFSEDYSHFCSVSLDRHMRIYNLTDNQLVREEFLYQKLEKCRFSPESFDFEAIEIEEEEGEEQEEEVQADKKLFRDKLEKAGGKLTHNYIKLKYERRHQQGVSSG